jgi:hypothetical protein
MGFAPLNPSYDAIDRSRTSETLCLSVMPSDLGVMPPDLASVTPAGRMVKAVPPDIAPVVEAGRNHTCTHAYRGTVTGADMHTADAGAHLGSGIDSGID